MRAKAAVARGCTLALITSAAVMGLTSLAQADGDEMLGLIDVVDGSDVIMAGVGLVEGQPGSIDIVIPPGVSIEQVLLYWNGFALTADEQGEMDTITVDGGAVTGDRIGGPNFFFGSAWSSTYRAELSTSALSPGANALAIGGLDFGRANNGAGLLVIVDDGVNASGIQVADGDDTAFSGFPPPRDTTVPVVYNFAPAAVDRVADLTCFAASVVAGVQCRPNILRIYVDRVLVDEVENPFGSSDGLEWDTFSTTVDIPAGAVTVKVQAISGNLGNECRPGDKTTGDDASIVWVASTFALPEVPTTGACCLVGGACEDGLSPVECFAIAGLYQGDGTTCADVECPVFPPGACCLPDGSCMDGVRPAECLALGGVHFGPNTTCDTTDCDDAGLGACCIVGPVCVDGVTAAECAAAPGIFGGVGSTCHDVVCTPFPVGACCLPDGTCEAFPLLQCVVAGGAYLGPNTSCADVECPPVPTGACCLLDGSCQEVSPAQCLTLGGAFQGLDTVCDDVDCPTPDGACCFPNGDCMELSEDECHAQMGDFQGPGTDCATADCPQPGDQGCTPGYWRQNHHCDSYPAPYTCGTRFDAVFDDAFGDATLQQVAAGQAGGSNMLRQLGKHTVAALLNAQSGDVAYPLTPNTVIMMFDAVYPGSSSDYETLKNFFEMFNDVNNCPLN